MSVSETIWNLWLFLTRCQLVVGKSLLTTFRNDYNERNSCCMNCKTIFTFVEEKKISRFIIIFTKYNYVNIFYYYNLAVEYFHLIVYPYFILIIIKFIFFVKKCTISNWFNICYLYERHFFYILIWIFINTYYTHCAIFSLIWNL